MTVERLDLALVAAGLVRSRTAAAAAVAAGRVRVDGVVVTRPGVRVDDPAVLEVESDEGWVGRAAGKLDAALTAFDVPVAGRLALDVGASTGGFTQVLLQRGAARVIALDVGRDQLVPELRHDPRVTVVEGENARDLVPDRLAELTGDDARPDLVVVDVSFISLTKILPAAVAVGTATLDIVCLIKPQFEVGKARIRVGVVTEAADRADAVRSVLSAADALGLQTVGLIASPIVGARGNREVLAHLRRPRGTDQAEWSATIDRVVRAGDGGAG